MQLGLLTAPFPDSDLMDVADWATSEGFSALEIACWPVSKGPTRRYAGTTHIDCAAVSGAEARSIADMLADKGITISGLGYYPNPLHPDADHREMVIGHLKKVIDCASDMGVGVVNTFCGGDQSLNVDDNWDRAGSIWPDIIAYSKAKGVQLAFENCPMIFSYDEWPAGHNIAYSPRIWRRILEEWDGGVKINFDPSHLIYQMIDMEQFIREFGADFVHVHAKDLMIDHEGLYDRGILSSGLGWQVPRMPGLGDVDWPRFFAGLYREGYDGPVIVEHEDRDFEGADDKIKRGFQLARGVLSPYIK
jgi:sugar phosphate isomerase/epimerase